MSKSRSLPVAGNRTKKISVKPFAAALGAFVECDDLRFVDGDAKREIHQAWLDHLVLVFRGQKLTNQDLLQVSEIFGTTTKSATAPSRGLYEDIAIVSNVMKDGKPLGVLGAGELLWHSDHSFEEAPLAAALLYAVEVPPVGGDTHFCNMYLALDTLPAPLRARVQGLTIKNDGSHNSAGERRTNDVVTDLQSYVGASHPIIRTHPETEADVLYLGRRPNAYVNGLSVQESEELLNALWAHAAQPRFTWAQRWQVGDLVVWDNRCTMHRRDAFDGKARRVMHRAQCAGERPFHDPHLAGRSHARGKAALGVTA